MGKSERDWGGGGDLKRSAQKEKKRRSIMDLWLCTNHLPTLCAGTDRRKGESGHPTSQVQEQNSLSHKTHTHIGSN